MKFPRRISPCLLVIFLSAPLLLAQNGINASGRRIIRRPDPAYPQLARTLNVTGAVRLAVNVASDGAVKSIEVKGGNPLLVEAAELAVHDWKWEKLDHETTEVVEIHFKP